MFCIFGENSKIQNGGHFWGEEIFFQNYKEYIAWLRCGSKISTISLYLARFRRQKQIWVFAFSAKIHNGCHFWGDDFF